MKEIYNYLYLNDKLSSSGMPKAEQVDAIAQAGVNTVINLATDKSQGALQNEQELVASRGMKYIHIPVEWDSPTRQNLDDFMNAMDAHRDDHVLVHCQANFRATGFVTLYRILRLGWGKDDALSDLRKIWNPEKFPIWQKFVEENLGQETN
ncbi:MAG TPA: protein tyrosine phosphatase family protein, partial [Anaerolineales bacterium]|nr:protein tyrosine phosphatase family protein [Anaerolineales bacterium]